MRFALSFLCALLLSPSFGAAQMIELKTSCEPLPENVAGADYVPGVDAQGNPVAPANISSSENAEARNIFPLDIPIDLNTLRFLGLDVSDKANGAIDSVLHIGHIKIHEDGRAMFGDYDVSHRIHHECSTQEELGPVMKVEDGAAELVLEQPSVDTPQQAPRQKNRNGLRSDVPSMGEPVSGSYP